MYWVESEEKYWVAEHCGFMHNSANQSNITTLLPWAEGHIVVTPTDYTVITLTTSIICLALFTTSTADC